MLRSCKLPKSNPTIKMLSFLRRDTPRTATAHLNPITYEDGRASQQFHSPSHPYLVAHVIPATTAEHGRSLFNPPLHFHMYQTEDFNIISGEARFFLDGTTMIRKNGDHIHIPVNAFHRFENASEDGEDLVIAFRLDLQDFEMEERFFRNFFGYLDDLRKAGQQPSMFQICRFLYEVNGPLVCPGLGRKSTFIPRQTSWLVMVVVGLIIGEWLLGYKGTYPEYYLGDEQKKKR
jgi:mannose-6-phosphate isomerase-like protein (cupin superfamily)